MIEESLKILPPSRLDMATPSQYFIAWLKGLAGTAPFTQWIGMTPGDHYAYLAEVTDGTDPVTGISAREYQEKAESMQLSDRGAFIAIAVLFYYILRYSSFDTARLYYWTVMSVID